MEVKAFVKTILKDVTEAVEEATAESKTHKFTMFNGDDKKIGFDLAVVLEAETSGEAKAGILKIMSGKMEGKISEQVVNRIKFSILPKKDSERAVHTIS